MSQKNKEIVEKVNASFAAGSPEALFQNSTEELVWNMVGEKTTKGHQPIRAWMAQMEGSEPPKFTVDKMVAEGNSVICLGDMTMTEPKEAAGSYSYVDAYTFDGDKITELRSYVVKHKTEGERSEKAAG